MLLLLILLANTFNIMKYIHRWLLFRQHARHGDRLLQSHQFSQLSRYRTQLALNLLHMNDSEWQLIQQALRDYFLLRWQYRDKFIVLPSRAATVLWRACIEEQGNYEEFCLTMFGYVLQAPPGDNVLPSILQRQQQAGMIRCWSLARLQQQQRHSKQKQDLPLMFALDQMLDLKDGYHFLVEENSLLCSNPARRFSVQLPFEPQKQHLRY